MGLYLVLTTYSLPNPSLLIILPGLSTPPLVMWSRIRLGLHTPAQTIAGAALDIATACLALYAWRDGLGQWLEPQVDPVLRGLESRVGIDDLGEGVVRWPISLALLYWSMLRREIA